MTVVAEPKTDTTTPPAGAPPAGAPPATTPEVKGNDAPPADKADDKGSDKTILGDEGQPKDAPKDAPKQVAPEKYADFTLPEGTSLDKSLLEKATPLFKDLNLSQEQAQKLVTLQAESTKAFTDAALSDLNDQIKTWKSESTKLFGAKAQEEIGIASAAMDRFGSPELKEVLNVTGLGNHPELVKFFNKVGHLLREDNPPEGVSTNGRKSDAAVFYPGMEKPGTGK